MNDSQINIAIAEACGYYYMDSVWHLPNGARADKFPDCANDLNAMHEAEKVLTRYQQSVTYSDNLMKIVGYHTFDSAHATAQQRAEAFLRTIGKWNGGDQ